MRKALLCTVLWLGIGGGPACAEDLRMLPLIPADEFRIAEVFDNRLELFLELYATKDPQVVDYVTGRKVIRVIPQQNGETAYELAPHPFLIWWGRALWKDPEEDGINGNEVIQEDNVIFHANPYLRIYRDQ
jgi:hypothetical protein